jgi:hypothetical protein
MTDNGAELADQRFYGFKKGWEYAKFHTENGHVYMKDEDEQDL